MKCKAGLCPAFVPPTDNEKDQPHDLPAKGRTGAVILHTKVLLIRRFVSDEMKHMPLLSTITSNPVNILHFFTTNCNKFDHSPFKDPLQ